MNDIQDIANVNIGMVILIVFASIVTLKTVIDIILYFKDIKGKFGVKTNNDVQKEEFENRISALEKHDNWQYKEILKISEGIDEIKQRMDDTERRCNAKTVATLRNQLYSLHEKFTSYGYITRTGLKTFIELGKIYVSSGGNDIFKEKLKPEILDLPIKEDLDDNEIKKHDYDDDV